MFYERQRYVRRKLCCRGWVVQFRRRFEGVLSPNPKFELNLRCGVAAKVGKCPVQDVVQVDEQEQRSHAA
jgi:hypothetical protein